MRPRTLSGAGRAGAARMPPRCAERTARSLLYSTAMPDDTIRPAPIAPYPAEAPLAGEPVRRHKKAGGVPAAALRPRGHVLRFGGAGLRPAGLGAVLRGNGARGRGVRRAAG